MVAVFEDLFETTSPFTSSVAFALTVKIAGKIKFPLMLTVTESVALVPIIRLFPVKIMSELMVYVAPSVD